MSNEQLKHIFDDSVCLNRRQMKDYVEGIMTNEESYAVELHLNSCPFCSEAIDGLFEQKEGRSVETLVELDTEFLKDHFSLQHPHIHLNSLAAAQPVATHYPHKKRKNVQPLWRTVSIAAALALSLGIFWMMRYGKDNPAVNRPIADNQTPALKKSSEQPIADNTPVNTTQPSPSAPQPVNNGSDPKAPQTLLLADKKDDTNTDNVAAQPAEAVKALEAREAPPAAKKEMEDVAVTAYKVPLIDRYSPGTKNVAAEQVEKIPTRSTEGMASTTAGVYNNTPDELKKTGTADRAETVQLSSVEVQKLKRSRAAKPADDYLEDGDAFYNERKYNQALREYRKELNSTDRGRRQKAALMSARSYLALGQKTEAKKLLEDLVQNGSGGAKREAKRMLDDLTEE